MMIDASGEPFPQLMQTLVLSPVGMTHSTYQQPLPSTRLKDVALPADEHGVGIPGGPHTYPEMAAAGLWTTPSDLALWIIELQRDLKGGGRGVLSPEMAHVMLTPIKDDYGPVSVSSSRTANFRSRTVALDEEHPLPENTPKRTNLSRRRMRRRDEVGT